MRAMVYHGPGRRAWEEVKDPQISGDRDAIIKVAATTICGTDLRILSGDLPAVRAGLVLGHEAAGTVVQAGDGVHTVRPGDKVLVSSVSACGTCRYCREGRYGQCLSGGGWILGRTIDGTQAEYVRVPFADTSLYPVPDGVPDEEILMLSDILPTAYEAGVLNGKVRPGDTVAVIGAGPVGLSAISGAQLFSAARIIAIDLADSRLAAAKDFGADVTVNPAREDPADVISQLTGGLGADVTIEAAGAPAAFELAVALVRPGGHVASIGVHGQPVTLHLERDWNRDLTITTGLADTYTIPTLLELVRNRQIDARKFITHHYPIEGLDQAYDTFINAAETGAIKVLLTS